jgi:hypothetical protein
MLWGGVTVGALESASSQKANLAKLIKYLRYDQPRQIKQNINNIIRSYKSKGKKYPGNIDTQLSDSDIKQLYKRFKVNYSQTPFEKQHLIRDLTWATESYLRMRINGWPGGRDNVNCLIDALYGTKIGCS